MTEVSWDPYIAELEQRLEYERSRNLYTGVIEAKLDQARRAKHTNTLSMRTGQHHCLDCFEPFELGKLPCKRPRNPLPPEAQ